MLKKRKIIFMTVDPIVLADNIVDMTTDHNHFPNDPVVMMRKMNIGCWITDDNNIESMKAYYIVCNKNVDQPEDDNDYHVMIPQKYKENLEKLSAYALYDILTIKNDIDENTILKKDIVDITLDHRKFYVGLRIPYADWKSLYDGYYYNHMSMKKFFKADNDTYNLFKINYGIN